MTLGPQVSPRWVGSHLVLPTRSDPPQLLPHYVLLCCWPPSGSDTLQVLAHIRAFAHAVPTSQNAPLPLHPHCSHVATRQMPTPSLCLLQLPRPRGASHSTDATTLSIGTSASPLCCGSSSPRATRCSFLSSPSIEMLASGRAPRVCRIHRFLKRRVALL